MQIHTHIAGNMTNESMDMHAISKHNPWKNGTTCPKMLFGSAVYTPGCPNDGNSN